MKKRKTIREKVKWWITEGYRGRLKYIQYCKKYPIDDSAILLEAQHGSTVNGNIFYILRELSENPAYAGYNLYVSIHEDDVEKTEKLLATNGIKRYTFVIMPSKEYFKAVATAKYLINDNTFLQFFRKREGQVYINTWHGTPMKALGKENTSDAHQTGNTQRNFIMADYLLFPNEYTRERMVRDYMLENLSHTTLVMGGYPRNEIFFDQGAAESILEKHKLSGKQVIAYMPTFRGSPQDASNLVPLSYVIYYINELDKLLNEDQVFYVNLHPIIRCEVDFSKFKNVREFPPEYETYAFLSAVDVLITDYSSVFFDFAVTGKKTILFAYDEEEYLQDRGMYMRPAEAPFPIVHTLEELLAELRRDKAYDERAFVDTYCAYDGPDAAKKLLAHCILGQKCLREEQVPSNGKQNVLIYGGDLTSNGVTISLKSLLERVDRSKYNYFLTFRTEIVVKNLDTLREIAKMIPYFPQDEEENFTLWEKIWFRLFKSKLLSASWFMRLAPDAMRRQMARKYGGASFGTTIQYNGYEHTAILEFCSTPANSAIFVHNNMVEEIRVRKNQRHDVLKYAYNHYDKVAMVTEDMRESTLTFANSEDALVVTPNIINTEKIHIMAKHEPTYDAQTNSNVDLDALQARLNSDRKKIITIGRFSPEKRHAALIDMFDRLYQENPEMELVIIGGKGKLYGSTVKHAESKASADHISIIRSLKNPYAILSRCDGFILPSLHEGFGVVLAEADTLGLPVACSDIPGPRGFMQRYDGYLFESSEEGILSGLRALCNGEAKRLNVDYDQYNKEAVQSFESLMIPSEK